MKTSFVVVVVASSKVADDVLDVPMVFLVEDGAKCVGKNCLIHQECDRN